MASPTQAAGFTARTAVITRPGRKAIPFPGFWTENSLPGGDFRSSRQDSHPVSWRFVVTDKNGKVTVDKTLEESQLIRDGADFLTPV